MDDAGVWPYGPWILGCGTFGGIGSSASLVGRGLDEQAAIETMDEAVALGISLIDTAEGYAGGASELMVGRWLASQRDADTVHIQTKVAPARESDVGRAFDAPFLEEKFSGSLERLGVEHVEVLLTHAPDDTTPIEATLEGLERIRESGRCSTIGASNLDAPQLRGAIDAAERLGIRGYRVLQNGYSLLQPEADAEVRAICVEHAIAYTPYSPLAGGILTGKYKRATPPPEDSRMSLRPDGNDELLTAAVFDAIDLLRERALDFGVDCGALALAWLHAHDQVASVVTGPSTRSPHLGLAAQTRSVELSDAVAGELRARFAAACEA